MAWYKRQLGTWYKRQSAQKNRTNTYIDSLDVPDPQKLSSSLIFWPYVAANPYIITTVLLLCVYRCVRGGVRKREYELFTLTHRRVAQVLYTPRRGASGHRRVTGESTS